MTNVFRVCNLGAGPDAARVEQPARETAICTRIRHRRGQSGAEARGQLHSSMDSAA